MSSIRRIVMAASVANWNQWWEKDDIKWRKKCVFPKILPPLLGSLSFEQWWMCTSRHRSFKQNEYWMGRGVIIYVTCLVLLLNVSLSDLILILWPFERIWWMQLPSVMLSSNQIRDLDPRFLIEVPSIRINNLKNGNLNNNTNIFQHNDML